MPQIRTENEMFPLVELWQQSDLTQKEFSRQQQIPVHVFTYWVSKYRKLHQQNTPSIAEESASFIPITAHGATDMEVEFPSGVVVRFASTVPVAYLQQLLSACSD